jgi:hypothetical protein
MAPNERNGRSEGFEYESVGVVPYSDGMFGEVYNQFLAAVGEEALNFGCLIYFDVPE